jgi:hypothetical protein
VCGGNLRFEYWYEQGQVASGHARTIWQQMQRTGLWNIRMLEGAVEVEGLQCHQSKMSLIFLMCHARQKTQKVTLSLEKKQVNELYQHLFLCMAFE